MYYLIPICCCCRRWCFTAPNELLEATRRDCFHSNSISISIWITCCSCCCCCWLSLFVYLLNVINYFQCLTTQTHTYSLCFCLTHTHGYNSPLQQYVSHHFLIPALCPALTPWSKTFNKHPAQPPFLPAALHVFAVLSLSLQLCLSLSIHHHRHPLTIQTTTHIVKSKQKAKYP